MPGDYGPLGEDPWSKGIMHTGGYDSPAERAAREEPARPSAPSTEPSRRDEPARDERDWGTRASAAPAPSSEHLLVIACLLAWYATYATVHGMYAAFTPAEAGEYTMMMMASPAPLLGLFAGPATFIVWWRASERRRQGGAWLWATAKSLATLGILVFGTWLVWRAAWSSTFDAWMEEFRARQVEMRSAPPSESRRARVTRRARRSTSTPRPASGPRDASP